MGLTLQSKEPINIGREDWGYAPPGKFWSSDSGSYSLRLPSILNSRYTKMRDRDSQAPPPISLPTRWWNYELIFNITNEVHNYCNIKQITHRKYLNTNNWTLGIPYLINTVHVIIGTRGTDLWKKNTLVRCMQACSTDDHGKKKKTKKNMT